jgi:hypothetical protein
MPMYNSTSLLYNGQTAECGVRVVTILTIVILYLPPSLSAYCVCLNARKRYLSPNVVIHWVALLLLVREVPCLYLDPETGCPPD